VLKMDGFDDCIVGVVERCGQESFLVYDVEKVIQKLQDTSEMDYHEAVEYFHFNQADAWLGEGTPGFLDRDWEDYIENEER
jgi:hypothetical protein